MGKDKPAVIDALKYLVELGIDVSAVVGPLENQLPLGKEKLIDIAHQFGIRTVTDDALYDLFKKNTDLQEDFLKDVDLVISFLFWKKIRKPLIDLPKIGCVNFHAAPLPDFRGVNGYSFAIYENLSYWGVSAHFVDESFDTGDIIKTVKFNINPENETAFSLEQKSQSFLLSLFKEIIEIIMVEGHLSRHQQEGGRYISKTEFENLRKIQTNDNLKEIERKIRAFWYPPYQGASIVIQGKEFTIVDEQLLKDIGKRYHTR